MWVLRMGLSRKGLTSGIGKASLFGTKGFESGFCRVKRDAIKDNISVLLVEPTGVFGWSILRPPLVNEISYSRCSCTK